MNHLHFSQWVDKRRLLQIDRGGWARDLSFRILMLQHPDSSWKFKRLSYLAHMRYPKKFIKYPNSSVQKKFNHLDRALVNSRIEIVLLKMWKWQKNKRKRKILWFSLPLQSMWEISFRWVKNFRHFIFSRQLSQIHHQRPFSVPGSTLDAKAI